MHSPGPKWQWLKRVLHLCRCDMRERWDDLRIFLFVARQGGLTGAARALKLDPATVGRRIQAFEAALDRPLFVRSPQGYALTEDGARLLPRAEAVETEMRAGLERNWPRGPFPEQRQMPQDRKRD